MRQVDFPRGLLDTDPYASFALGPDAKRVVSFVRVPISTEFLLPIESDGARILSVVGTEVFTAYVPSENGPVFMRLNEKTFGTDVTTRTWETVRKCAIAKIVLVGTQRHVMLLSLPDQQVIQRLR